MDISQIFNDQIQKQEHSQSIVNAILYNTVIKFYMDEKSLDISDYISAIKIWNDKVIVKISSSSLKEELLFSQKKLEEKIQKKLEKIWKSYKSIELIIR